MKATGIIRRIDQLGRIVIPKELRTTLEIEDGDPMEIFTENGNVIFRPYRIKCVCCGNEDGLVSVNDIPLCTQCIEQFDKVQNSKQKGAPTNG